MGTLIAEDVLEDIENTHKLQEQRGGKGRVREMLYACLSCLL
jgi:hypothetical protein